MFAEIRADCSGTGTGEGAHHRLHPWPESRLKIIGISEIVSQHLCAHEGDIVGFCR